MCSRVTKLRFCLDVISFLIAAAVFPHMSFLNVLLCFYIKEFIYSMKVKSSYLSKAASRNISSLLNYKFITNALHHILRCIVVGFFCVKENTNVDDLAAEIYV